MNIHFIGHSTFLLESGEHRLLIDPFIEGNPQATVTLAEAQLLLSFPRTLGVDEASGNPITVQDGPLGPYVKCGTESRSLRDHEHMRTLTLEEARTLLAEPRPRGRRQAASVLADLGPHPDSEIGRAHV